MNSNAFVLNVVTLHSFKGLMWIEFCTFCIKYMWQFSNILKAYLDKYCIKIKNVIFQFFFEIIDLKKQSPSYIYCEVSFHNIIVIKYFQCEITSRNNVWFKKVFVFSFNHKDFHKNFNQIFSENASSSTIRSPNTYKIMHPQR